MEEKVKIAELYIMDLSNLKLYSKKKRVKITLFFKILIVYNYLTTILPVL